MSEFRERAASQPGLITEFDSYALQKAQEIESLSSFFGDALSVVENTNAVNEQLSEAGRPDLAITNRAPMFEIMHPDEVLKRCNNFNPNFHVWTGMRETGKTDYMGKPEKEPVPATKEELLELRQLPKFSSYEEYVAVRDSDKFAALSRNGNHADEPAFLRMLILFPEFTTSLVADMSRVENKHYYDRFQDRLYVAYQIMSRLVDASDLHVRKKDGELDDLYLCR